MRLRYRFPLVAAVLILSMAACDDFNLMDQFLPNGGLQLSAQKETLGQGETIELYPSGGTEPYSWTVEATDLLDNGADNSPPGTVDAKSMFTAGNEVGLVTVRFTDSGGFTSEGLELTIIPKDPLSLSGTVLGPISVKLDWIYPDPPGTGYISGFVLTREGGGSAEAPRQTLAANTLTYTDSVTNNVTYIYRIYAIADTASGSYKSLGSKSVTLTP